jgi:hypothetical protein
MLLPRRSFYHRLMKPMVHYVPFWRKLPQEALQAVKWAMENDAEAHHIAKNAQKLMQRYLHHQALDCYWLMHAVQGVQQAVQVHSRWAWQEVPCTSHQDGGLGDQRGEEGHRHV